MTDVPPTGSNALPSDAPSRPSRLLLIGIALVGALGSAELYRRWSAEQRDLAGLLERADAARTIPGLAERVRRANRPLDARLRAMRPLIAQYIDPTWLFDVPEEIRLDVWERSRAATAEIRQLAADTLSRRPTSWEAWMTLGAATWIETWGTDMAAATTDMAAWEEPLRRAEDLIPGYLEPTKYLAVAYVHHWQSLSATQRREAMATLQEAFRDQRTFNLTIELWLRRMPIRSEALAIVPDEPFAWRRLEAIFQRNQEWDLYLEAHHRFRQAEGRRIDDLLDEAEARLAGGDYRRGKTLFHQVTAALKPEAGNLARLQRTLDHMPPGPVSRGAARSLRQWLDWTLALGFVRGNPLEPEQLRRLVGAVPDVAAPEAAIASILNGDLAAAERLERQHTSRFSDAWDPYFVLKSEAMVARQEFDAARLSLLRVRGSWDNHPSFLRARTTLAEATNDLPQLDAVRQRAADLASTTWRGHQMNWSNDVARLELLPEAVAPGLTIEFLEASAQGLPVEIYWNGALVGTRIAYPGEVVSVDVGVLPEVSLLEVRSAVRRPFAPGRIRLTPAAL